MAFRTRIPVRFGHEDHAGIVYYPRFFHYFHIALEEFFDQQGLRFVDVLDRDRIGFPVVHVDADFKRPLRFGDVLAVDVTVEKIGRSSIRFRYDGRKEAGQEETQGEPIVTAAISVVTVNLDTLTSVPVPAHVRALLERHQAPAREAATTPDGANAAPNGPARDPQPHEKR